MAGSRWPRWRRFLGFYLGDISNDVASKSRSKKRRRLSFELLEDRLPPAADLVADINITPTDENEARFTGVVDVNGFSFFTATDAGRGTELWRTDGTAAGTFVVKDIAPGSTASSPTNLINVNGTLFFAAYDSDHGRQLWKSDGTVDGTVMISSPDNFNFYPRFLTNVNGRLFFAGYDSAHGWQLWKSDGTTEGTVPLKEFGASPPTYLTNVDGTLYFSANDPSGLGTELWKSDGFRTGTMMVKDINPLGNSSNPKYMTNVAGTVYFVAGDGVHGDELWKTDGTESGTVMVKDVNAGTAFPRSLTNVGGTLYFSADDGVHGTELWKSDGSDAGTLLVKDINPAGHSSPGRFINVNGTLFFKADDGSNGIELWKSDGTTTGTQLVADIWLGDGSSSPENFAVLGSKLYFSANDGARGIELWSTDGSEAGTRLVKDIIPGAGSSNVNWLRNINGTLFFVANSIAPDMALWKSDGTTAGTVPVKTVRTGTAGSNPTWLADVGGTVYFAADGGYPFSTELWKSDGTAARTVMVKDIAAGGTPSNLLYLTTVGGTLYFTDNDVVHGEELWRSDGTEAGTVMVKDINPTFSWDGPRYLTDVDGVLCFRANDGVQGFGLWKSDGTELGTVMVKAFGPSNYPRWLTNVGGTLFFAAKDAGNNWRLWKSDGTEDGTVLADPSGGATVVTYLAKAGNTIFFNGTDGVHGRELWKYDAAAGATVMVKDIRFGGADSYPLMRQDTAAVGNTLYFVADDGLRGRELWQSDGTAAGTMLVADIKTGFAVSSNPHALKAVGNTVYFLADDGSHGVELWKTTGTSAGAVMVMDINAGLGDADVSYLTDVKGLLYFQANDVVHGDELWRSDGTEAGTTLVSDAIPGSGGTNPRYMTASGPLLFFAANDETHGRELHALTIDRTLDPSIDLAENNAAQWGGFAGAGETASVANDTSDVRVGSGAIKFTTNSGGDAGISYPATPNATIDASICDYLQFWVKATNDNAGGFQYGPRIDLITAGGKIHLEPALQPAEMTDRAWRFYRVPLSGDREWVRKDTGAPYLVNLRQLQIHFDTNGTGFEAVFDGVEFVHVLSPGGELTEDGGGTLGSFAPLDGDIANVTIDTTRVQHGANAVRLTTTRSLDTGFSFTAAGVTHLDLSSSDTLHFAAYAHTDSPLGFQGNQPTIDIYTRTGIIRYEFQGVHWTNNQWRVINVPFAGNSEWVRIDFGAPSLLDVSQFDVRLHAWGDDFFVVFDDMRFIRNGIDLADGNATEWGSFSSDGAFSSVTDERQLVHVGSASLLFTTASGSDTGIRYPAAGIAHINVSASNYLKFWAYISNDNDIGFQAKPSVVLQTADGAIRYQAQSMLITNNAWRLYEIPLAGDDQWARSDTEHPTLSEVQQIEIHLDTWGNGFSAVFDGLEFVNRDIGVQLDKDSDTALLLHLNGSLKDTDDLSPFGATGVDFVAGQVGQAAHIGSPGYIQFENDGNINPSAGTIEFWIRPDWNGAGNVGHTFFQAGQEFDNGMVLSIDGSGRLLFRRWGDDGTTPKVETNVESFLAITDANLVAGRWYYLAATWSDVTGEMAYYINGQQRAIVRGGVTIGDFSGTTFRIGSNIRGASPANAAFDEFRITRKARDASEIRGNYEHWLSPTAHGSQVLASTSDAAGNVYVTGSFQGTVDFDPGRDVHPLTSSGGKDVFVACYAPSGAYRWAYKLGGANDDEGTGITVDANGAYYLSATFQKSIEVPLASNSILKTTLNSIGSSQDVIVCKFGPASNLVWVHQVGGPDTDTAAGVSVDASGNVLVVGDFVGTVDFDPSNVTMNLSSLSSRDVFVWKLSPTGALVWARSAGSTKDDTARGVAVDADGAVYVTGTFQGTADFDPGTGLFALDSAGGTDVFAWKLDAAGEMVWARSAGAAEDDVGAGIGVSGDNVYVTGSFAGSADFGSSAQPQLVKAAGSSDAFVWSLSTAGEPRWARNLGGTAIDAGHAVAADSSGVYVAGDFQDTGEFDPGSGRLLLASQGNSDAFLAKLDTDGNRLWARSLGGDAIDHAAGVTIGPASITFAGSYSSTAIFDSGHGVRQLAGDASATFFVASVPVPLVTGGDAFEPNDSSITAVDLGPVSLTSTYTLNGLSLHSSQDEDWFRFVLLTSPSPNDKIYLSFASSRGDIDLELHQYDRTSHPEQPGDIQPGKVKRFSKTHVDSEEILLDGLQPGTYYIRVFGQANDAYSLSLVVPRAATRDRFDTVENANDTFANATDLGIIRDTTVYGALSIHAAGDEDWYRFTILEKGMAASSVAIAFQNAQGNLDIRLLDGYQNEVRRSTGSSDVEAIVLDGLYAGTYCLRVYARDVLNPNRALNPDYTLTIVPPPPLAADQFEPNDSRATATPLGDTGTNNVVGEASWNYLSLHVNDAHRIDQDFYSFNIVAAGGGYDFVRIDFQNSLGDLDLQLYDAAGKLLGASTTQEDFEQVSLQGLAAGTYFVRVFGLLQPTYLLTIDAPEGSIHADRLEGTTGNNTQKTATLLHNDAQAVAGVMEVEDVTLHTSKDQDWYTFTTEATANPTHAVRVKSDPASGTLTLKLFGKKGALLGSAQSTNGTAALSLNGKSEDTYFIQVTGAVSAYTLELDTPTPAGSDWTVLVYITADTLAKVAFKDINNLEKAASAMPGVNFVVLWDQSDIVATYPTGNGTQSAWGMTGRAVISPDTNPNQIATTFEVLPEQDTGDGRNLRDFLVWAMSKAPARHYALSLWDHGGGLNGFNADVNDTPPLAARPPADLSLHVLTPSELAAALTGLPGDTLTQHPRIDLVAFDSCSMGEAEVAYQLKNVTDVVVASQDVTLGLPYDTAFSVLGDNLGHVSAETLATNMVRKFVQRWGVGGPNDTMAAIRTSALIDLAASLQAFSAAVGTASLDDQKKLVSAAASVFVYGDAELNYQRDLGTFMEKVVDNLPGLKTPAKNVLISLSDAVIDQTDDPRGSSGLSIYLPVVTSRTVVNIDSHRLSNYATDYSDFNAATGWVFALQQLEDLNATRPVLFDDSYDNANRNDTSAAASDLGSVESEFEVQGLNLYPKGGNADVDWYSFTIDPKSDNSVLAVHLDESGSGQLTAVLSDSDPIDPDIKRPLVHQDNVSAATLVLTNLTVGQHTFYLRVEGTADPGYRITIDAPESITGTDWAGLNSTRSKSYALTASAGGDYPGLNLGPQDKDWFVFDAPKNMFDGQVVIATSDGPSLLAQIRDANENVVSTGAAGGAGLTLPCTLSEGDRYYLFIQNVGSAAVHYAIGFEDLPDASAPAPSYVLDRFEITDTRTDFATGSSWAVTAPGSVSIKGGMAAIAAGSSAQALWQNFSAADSFVQALIAPGTGNQTISLFARASTNQGLTGYEGRLTLALVNKKWTWTPQLFRLVKGQATALAAAGTLQTLGDGNPLRLEVQGQHLRFLLGKKVLVEATDSATLPAGKVGFGASANASADMTFDDFKAGPLAPALPLSVDADAVLPAQLGAGWQSQAVTSRNTTTTTAIYAPASVADISIQVNYVLQNNSPSFNLIARWNGTVKTAANKPTVITHPKSYLQAQIVKNTSGIVTAKLLQNSIVLSSRAGLPTSGTLHFEVQGNLLRLYVDDPASAVLASANSTVPLAGQIGLITTGAVSLGNLVVSPLSSVTSFADSFSDAKLSSNWLVKQGALSAGGRMAGAGGKVLGLGLWVGAGSSQSNVTVAGNVVLGPGLSASLVARYTENSTYYEARLSADASGRVTASLWRIVSGKPTQLKASQPFALASGRMTFALSGSTLTLAVDNMSDALTVTDAAIAGPGLSGVILSQGAALDDFSVTTP